MVVFLASMAGAFVLQAAARPSRPPRAAGRPAIRTPLGHASSPDNALPPAPTAEADALQEGNHDHDRYMGLALEQAQEAFARGEVPIGAVLVSPQGEVLSVGRNRVEATGDASAHAEMECLRGAAAAWSREKGHWRMLDCTLYVTLEPCLMCLGACQSFRVRRVVYGARNTLLGAVESYLPALERPHPFHQVQAVGGVRAQECGALMRDFFARRRVQGKEKEEAEEEGNGGGEQHVDKRRDEARV